MLSHLMVSLVPYNEYKIRYNWLIEKMIRHSVKNEDTDPVLAGNIPVPEGESINQTSDNSNRSPPYPQSRLQSGY